MRLVDANGDFWYDFGDEPNEKARQFMKEHFGFETIDHLSDDECEEIQYEIAEIQAYLESERGYGTEHEKPYSEYGRMVMGIDRYIGTRWGNKE